MPANPWELRADVRPLDAAALRWLEIGALMARRGDELVDAARHATEGWDSEAAESYERHRRQVLTNLDRFTTLTTEISGSLKAISSILTSAQKELDQAWVDVATVPHELVGESRHLVFHPSQDDDHGRVARGQAQTDEIRNRMALSLDQESTRLRSARAELVGVRTELTTLAAAGAFPIGAAPGEEASGVGVVQPHSTAVPGSAQSGVSGVSALPPVAPISVTVPDLAGLASTGLAPVVATAAGMVAGRKGARRATDGTPPVGGMGAGGMAARAGAMSRGMAGGRSGSRRLAAPTLQGVSAEQADRLAREKAAARQAARESKQAALADKRARRAARRAEREAEREGHELTDDPELTDLDEGADDDAPDADPKADGGGVAARLP